VVVLVVEALGLDLSLALGHLPPALLPLGLVELNLPENARVDARRTRRLQVVLHLLVVVVGRHSVYLNCMSLGPMFVHVQCWV
jgi:hypothetical protein